jgi:hypothetical protein
MNFFTPKLMKIRWPSHFIFCLLQHYGPCKISLKKSKTSHLDCSGHIEGDVMQNHEEKK